MIKILNLSKKKNLNELEKFLEKRREGKNVDVSVVEKILKDIKKNKIKAVIKYEKRYSKNYKLFPKKGEINHILKKLDKNVKRAIDYAHNRIRKFHKLQKTNSL